MKTRILLVGALVGTVLSLSACSGGEPMTASPSVSEPNTTPTASYTLPPRPQLQPPEEPNLTGTDIDSAYALAKFYFELYPYVKATGDTALWEKYAHPECEYCKKVLDAAIKDNKTGAWTHASLGILDDAKFVAHGDVDFRIDFLVERSKIIYYGSQGINETEPAQHSVVLGIKDEGGKFLVRSFDILIPDVFGKVDL
ncbi:DUF6318 family protein [Trueperella pyogenes]|uniref:DUF6318 family protein n=2 Tax=Trueperella pyogenes TaxID=1661 RepID=UPI003245B1DB